MNQDELSRELDAVKSALDDPIGRAMGKFVGWTTDEITRYKSWLLEQLREAEKSES